MLLRARGVTRAALVREMLAEWLGAHMPDETAGNETLEEQER
jgi:hypothetical protein